MLAVVSQRMNTSSTFHQCCLMSQDEKAAKKELSEAESWSRVCGMGMEFLILQNLSMYAKGGK